MTRATSQLGATGEQIAADHLTTHGFRILDRNYRTRHGELDIVAFDGTRIVFVEVKTKAHSGVELNPLLSIGPRKQLQVRHMAHRWLADRRDRPYARELRFDAIGIVIDAVSAEVCHFEHIPGAF
jgi:putative endonuclease